MLPLDRFCNLVWVWYAERLDETEWQRFESMIRTPTTAPEEAQADEGFEAFQQAFMREVSTG
jgi:hypothetical protein